MKLVFLYGPPAAGKLTVGVELARLTGLPLLDNHQILDSLPVLYPRSQPQFNSIRSALGRKLRLEIFSSAAANDRSFITTFAPLSPGMHNFIRDVRQQVVNAGGEFCLVQLLPSHEVLAERIVSESRKNKKIDNLARFHEVTQNNPGAFETFPDIAHLTLDNSNLSPTEAAEKIISYYKLPLQEKVGP